MGNTTLKLVSLALLTCCQITHAGEAEVRKAIQTLNPNAKVDSIKPSTAKGIMEVMIAGQPVYFTDDGKHLLQGTLMEVSSKRDLTELSVSKARKVVLDAAPQSEMIVFPAQGKPKHVIKVFTDMDCGYCRKLHQEITEINALGIEVQYLWFPRAGIPSESARKAVAVWCAADRQVAMTKAQSGVNVAAADCAHPVQKNFELAKRIGVNMTPAIFSDGGSMLPGYMPAKELLAELDRRAAVR